MLTLIQRKKMASKVSDLVLWLAILIGFFGTAAAKFCYSDYECTYGCCNGRCCDSPVALIVGLVVGGGVFIFIVILVICLCRRRRSRGFVYQNQPPMVITSTSTTTQGGMVNTAGVNPGVTYNQYQPYGPHQHAPTSQAYPQPQPYGNYGAPQPQSYGNYGAPQPQPYGNYAAAPAPNYAAGPPSYDSVAQQADGGLSNPGYDKK